MCVTVRCMHLQKSCPGDSRDSQQAHHRLHQRPRCHSMPDVSHVPFIGLCNMKLCNWHQGLGNKCLWRLEIWRGNHRTTTRSGGWGEERQNSGLFLTGISQRGCFLRESARQQGQWWCHVKPGPLVPQEQSADGGRLIPGPKLLLPRPSHTNPQTTQGWAPKSKCQNQTLDLVKSSLW